MQINFDKIPNELKKPTQWVNWCYVERDDSAKPTKLPYNPHTGELADVSDPSTWGTFAQAVANVQQKPEAWSGIGFVFTENDDYGFIDLDDTLGNVDAARNQAQIIELMDSYTETSPSGRGLHIIVRTKDKRKGVRKNFVEMYSKRRYGTFTGHVVRDLPISDRDGEWDAMYEAIAPKNTNEGKDIDRPETSDDRTIYDRAAAASNGEKFLKLWAGEWQQFYSSQSEADLSLINILGFYSQNREQIKRLFRQSGLGRRDKALRDDYVGGMITKAFDNVLEPIDISALTDSINRHREEISKTYEKYSGVINTTQKREEWPMPKINEYIDNMWEPYPIERPDGLIGEIADYIYASSYMPIYEAAIVAAFGMVSGMAGSAYNINGTGLNLYQLLVMPTGFGKEAVSEGMARLYEAVVQKKLCIAIEEFSGPSDFASGQALIKHVETQKSFCSIMDEFGLTLGKMTGDRAKENYVELRRQLLSLYTKSGQNGVLEIKAYAQKKENIKRIKSPGVSIIGLTTPETFYRAITEDALSDGLLPRMSVLEYGGYKPKGNPGAHLTEPPDYLLRGLEEMATKCHHNLRSKIAQNIPFDAEALEFFNWMEDTIRVIENHAPKELVKQNWTRCGMRTIRRAADLAVSRHLIEPIVNIHDMRYAFNMEYTCINGVYGRFREGTYGDMTHDNNQIRQIIRVCMDWCRLPYEDVKDILDQEELHKANIIPKSYIQRRLNTNKAFKHNYKKHSHVIKDTVNMMVENGELLNLDKKETQERFGFRGECVALAHPDKLAEIFKS